jgi:TBC1 domain family member 20
MDNTGPILIGSGSEPERDKEVQVSTSWKELPPHRDEDQVHLDVNRAFVYYPSGKTKSTENLGP